MSKQYHISLVEAVGASFYYYTHHKEINLTSATVDFEKFSSGWLDEYRGNWEIYNNSSPIVYNIFKPCVDQLVYRIMDATEKEIERKVAERVNEYISKLESKG